MKKLLTEVLSQIENNPSGEAFFIDNVYYTYEQFGNRIAAIRDCLAGLSEDGRIVGLAIHDDIDTYSAIFALWIEGRAYVPLHPYHPLDRNIEIIRQIGLTTIIDSAEDSPYSDYSIVNAKSCQSRGLELGAPIDIEDSELAYVLFTSGSTGVPKGVCISRGNVAAFMDSFWRTGITIGTEDRCLQCFDLTFDVSVQSYLVALTRGACVYTVPYGQVKYLYVASLIQEQRITFGAMAPSMLAYLRPYFDEFDATSLKHCILTAEACPVDLLEDWFKCACNAELYDFYGPTEATIYCTYYKLDRHGENLSINGVISIGKPLEHVKAVILDEDGRILPPGQKGELCVAGDQVTPGYWNSPEKNASSFFIKEINGIRRRFYHTGDLCYWDASGNIMYIGRIDQQAKIQGFRVELSEIEFHARRFFQEENRVLAIAFDNEKGLTEIALFIESTPCSIDDLTRYLRTKMPSYMIPSRFIFEPVFPLNSSDKVDRNKLKQKLI